MGYRQVGLQNIEELLASGVVLQMAKTAFENKVTLVNIEERGENPNLGRHRHVQSCCNRLSRHTGEMFPIRKSLNSRDFANRQDSASRTFDSEVIRRMKKRE